MNCVAAQQLVEIAKALALHAKLLLFDEPTASLGGDETELLFAQIRKLQAEGMSFIYISHRLDGWRRRWFQSWWRLLCRQPWAVFAQVRRGFRAFWRE